MSHSFELKLHRTAKINAIAGPALTHELEIRNNGRPAGGVVFGQILHGKEPDTILIRGAFIPIEYAKRIEAVLDEYWREKRRGTK